MIPSPYENLSVSNTENVYCVCMIIRMPKDFYFLCDI